MKRLFLMRHGQSPGAHEAGVSKDALRPLSDRGRRDAALMARELARRGAKPRLLLHSPLLRAAQTAAAAAAELKGPQPESFAFLDNTRPPEEVLEALESRAADADEILAVGHNPQLAELAALVGRSILDIRPAGLVALELEPKRRTLWSLNVDEL